MERLFYSTGQVARQLGTTLAAIRILCENRVIAAETSPGGHWRVPASEVERLKRDGLPPIARPLPKPTTSHAVNGNPDGYDYPEFDEGSSEEVVLAAEQVAISRSNLERRKVEREIEENEDWFRDRKRREAEMEAAARRKTEAEQAARRRQQWAEGWTQHAIRSLPYGAQGEMEPEVHLAVQTTLATLEPNQQEVTTRRLVDAAVSKALAPWHRKQNLERSLKAAMNKLPFDVQYSSEYGHLKQRAWEALIAATQSIRTEASYQEMQTAMAQAVQPTIHEYEHQQACERKVSSIQLFDLTPVERDEAREAVRKALAALPVGANETQLERTKEVALAPYNAAMAKRNQEARLASEKQAQRRVAGYRADSYLGHIEKYLGEEYDFDDRYDELIREVKRLKPPIREALIDELVENPDMTADEIRECIEGLIDD